MDPIRKRSRTTETGSTTTTQQHHQSNHHLLNEIDKLKTELAQSQSQRKLDKIQFENKAKRHQRHILTLEQDTKDANHLAEEIRSQSEIDLEELVQKRAEAVKDAEDWQRAYWELNDGGTGSEGAGNARSIELENELSLANRKNELMNQKLTALEEEIKLLKRLKDDTRAGSAIAQDTDASSTTDANVNVNANARNTSTPSKNSQGQINQALSPAPPAVLTELNRTRIKLAESERQNRQQMRNIDSLQSQANEMIQYRESSKNLSEKVQRLEMDLKVVRREREALRVVEKRWVEMRKELVKNNLGSEVLEGGATAGAAGDENIPPEIATVVRHFSDLEHQVRELQNSTSSLRGKYEQAQRRIDTLDTENQRLKLESSKFHKEKTAIKDQFSKAEMELRTIQLQEKVWKREAESMRSLLDTYKQMEDKMVKEKGSKGKLGTSVTPPVSDSDASVQGLQLSLSTSKEEIQLLRKQIDQSKIDRDALQTEMVTLKEEHENVRTKFMKLRSALFEEREKAERAEDRAAQAETMAGKGAFEHDTTRVLHLQNNPLTNAIRQKYEKEIEELKTELSELIDVQKGLKIAPITSSKSSDPALDAEKFSKRLKDQFRNQIQLFREGVHIITGYKIDMNVTDPDAPRFTVRSMFAERESDHLNFLWRTDKYGKLQRSMDILDTELAQLLSKEPSFEYVKKFNSIPAFTASVCLSLFEKQTIMS
jgi:hypothetical protein